MSGIVNKDQLQHFILCLKEGLIQNNSKLDSKSFSILFKTSVRNCQLGKIDKVKFIQSYPEHFAFDGGFVMLKTALTICPDHCAQGGCSDARCLNLHVCRFFFLSSCRFKGNACRFGHDLQNPHNTRALRYHMLEGLVFEDVKTLFMQHRSEATLPRVCKFYGVGERTCSKGEKCHDLHVCKFFLLDTCSFGSKCSKSHDLGGRQSMNILTNYGLRDQPVDDVKRLLCTVLQERRPNNPKGAEAKKPEIGESKTKQVVPKSEKTNPNKAPVLCLYALVDQCKFGEKCNKVHSTKPYQWQFESADDEWHNIADGLNEKIQTNYADPSKLNCRDCPISIKFNDEVVSGWINFNSMRLVANGKPSSKVRLLTTPSSVGSISRFATEWAWFWKDEHGKWNEYGALREGADNADISSKVIEEAHQEETPLLSFRTEHHEYELDLLTMVQRNLIEGTERPVCRRPKLPVDGTLGSKLSPGSPGFQVSPSTVNLLPAHWDKNALGGNVAYHRVELNRGSPEWRTVQTRFAQTMSTVPVRSVFRIQNEELWETFSCKKKWMEKSLSNANEKLLFHGTRNEYIDAISQQGFDWRISGLSVGTKFGKGSYFARDAAYSKNYTDCRQMFLVRVLVGDSTQGSSSYVKPPEKSSGGAYNSCVDRMSDPSIYIIFEHAQTYPEYLITY